MGASPDGLVRSGDGSLAGIVEYKAPVYSMYDGVPPKYMAQIQGQMGICGGVPWCDFMAVGCR